MQRKWAGPDPYPLSVQKEGQTHGVGSITHRNLDPSPMPDTAVTGPLACTLCTLPEPRKQLIP